MMTTDTEPPIFVAGGTLPPGALSYIPRRADDELLEGLLKGEFCYALTSRQMGKSSLMVRTAARLREQGVRVAMLDLTAIGRNLTPDQWYYALLLELGDSLGMEDLVEETWNEVAAQAPLHGFLRTLRKMIRSAGEKSVVVFIDEVDYVRSLSFSVDEFFAAIRACYNERATDPAWNRLTFCLLGVASPTDLIRDPRVTPFNIGRPVRLEDFTERELLQLVLLLEGGNKENAAMLLKSILGWTGGHPYLTQKLLRALSETGRAINSSLVNDTCHRIFLTPHEKQMDSNLLFVQSTILHSESDLSKCLELYRKVLSGRSVREAESDRIAGILRLSGVVKAVGGCLRPRNAIYRQVFDAKWIEELMPDAEIRRQQAAYWRGALRAAGLSAAVLCIMMALMLWNLRVTWTARQAANAAKAAAALAAKESTRANASAIDARRLLYFADMLQASQAWESGNMRLLNTLLEETRSNENRAFEWDYWDRLAHLGIAIGPDETVAADRTASAISPNGSFAAIGEAGSMTVYDSRIHGKSLVLLNGENESAAAISSGGRRLATVDSRTKEVSVWDVQLGTLCCRTPMRDVLSLRFSPDGNKLGALNRNGEVLVCDTRSGRLLPRLRSIIKSPQATSRVEGFCFSPSSAQIATYSVDGTIRIWSGAVAKLTFHGSAQGGRGIAYSPDGRTLASCGEDQRLILWRTSDGRLLREARSTDGVNSLSFSPDGRRLATGGSGGAVHVMVVDSLQEVFQLRGHKQALAQVAFTLDGRRILSRDEFGNIKLWSADGEHAVVEIAAHKDYAISAIFSPDGKRIVTVGGELVSRVWDLATERPLLTLRGHSADLYAVDASPDGRWIATGAEDKSARIWDAATGRQIRVLQGHAGRVNTVRFSPDSTLLVTAGEDHKAILWNVSTGTPRATWTYPERIWCAAFSPDGSRVALGGMAGTIEVRRVADGHLECSAGNPGVVKAAAFSPDGRWIAGTTNSQTAEIWDSHTGHLERIFLGHENLVNDVSFSPDGRRLLTAGYDGTARLWDTATGREVLTLSGRRHKLSTARFSPDGKQIVTSSLDGTISIWSSIRQTTATGGLAPLP